MKAMLRVLLHNTGGAEQDKPLNLRQFIPQAAELARQRQFSQRGPRHDISTMRTALRLGRQVSALTGILSDDTAAGPPSTMRVCLVCLHLWASQAPCCKMSHPPILVKALLNADCCGDYVGLPERSPGCK